MQGIVAEIYVTPKGGAAMRKVDQVEAVANCGLRGDRYCERTGYWTSVDECQVTLIETEDLEAIEQTTGIQVRNGEHRRNLITRDVRLESFRGKQFQIGEVVFEYDRPRPPCTYVESLTEPGMTRALVGRGGICARVLKSGLIRTGDPIVILQHPSLG